MSDTALVLVTFVASYAVILSYAVYLHRRRRRAEQ